MTLDEQIAVMQAFRDGAEIQCRFHGTSNAWEPWQHHSLNFAGYDYRIAPKKEMTLVERLRSNSSTAEELCQRAADQIELLEEALNHAVEAATTDELLAEIARRIGK